MRVVVTGASGQLGAYLLRALLGAGHAVSAWSGRGVGERFGVTLRPVDLTDATATERALSEADPAVVLHAAAVSRADEARLDPGRARAVNVEATARLADWCARNGRRLVSTSTDLVFAGLTPWNREDDPAVPVLTYGRTKLEGEAPVLAAPGGLVARLSLLFGPSRAGREGYYDRTIAALRRGEPQTFFRDEYRTPLDLATAAAVLVRLASGDAAGLIHVGGLERLSRHELMRRVAAAAGMDEGLVRANRQAEVASPEPRPADVSLDTTRLAHVLPDLRRPTVEEAVAAMGV
jgi:dTDP-4-dehydrorhamnose reductase